MTKLLRVQGYSVENATDGSARLAMALGEDFDLIIPSITLRCIKGVDVCRRLREKGCNAAILTVAERTERADAILSPKLGADTYVTTPIEPAEFMARVANWVGGSLARRAGDHPSSSVLLSAENPELILLALA